MANRRDVEQAFLLGALLLSFRSSEKALTRERIFSRHVTPSHCCTDALLKALMVRGVIDIDDSRSSATPLGRDYPERQEIRIKGASPADYNRLLNFQLDFLSKKAFGKRDRSAIRLWIARLLVAECMAYADFYAFRNGIAFRHNEYPARLEILLSRRTLGQVFMLIWRAVKSLSSDLRSDQEFDFEIIVDQVMEYDLLYERRGINPDSYARPTRYHQSLLSSLIMNKLLGISDDYIHLTPISLCKHIEALF